MECTHICSNVLQDDQLGQMMRFIKDGYKKKTEIDRKNYGLRLQKALDDFTKTFLPHMQEEEEVLQSSNMYFGWLYYSFSILF